MCDYTKLSPKDVILLATAISVALTDGLDTDAQNFLGNFLVTIGQNVLTAAAQSQAIEDKKSIKQSQFIK